MSKKPPRKHPVVLNRYADYHDLCSGSKATRGNGIFLKDLKGSNVNYYLHTLESTHSVRPEEMRVVTEMKVDCHKSFKFKLFASLFMGEPLMNYDSDGPSHDNAHLNTLINRSVDTPHFNCYDKDGYRIAYKTAAMQDPLLIPSLEKADNCIILFYDECNITHSPAGYPSVNVHGEQLPIFIPTPEEEDPNGHDTYFA